MTEPERDTGSSTIFWTTSAVAIHGVLWVICLMECIALPRFIKIYDDFDAQLPALTALLIGIYSALGLSWFAIPLVVLALLLADAWILRRLSRNPSSRGLAVMWACAVTVMGLVAVGLVTVALLLPLFELMNQLS